MKAKCCDRCGKLYLNEELKSELVLMRETGKKYKTRSALDLCKDCREDLERWLENGSKASNYKPDKNNGRV